MRFILLILFLISSLSTIAKTIIISDANETILKPYPKNPFASLEFYEGIPELLTKTVESLDEAGVSLHIVSNTVEILYRGGLKETLIKYGVPLEDDSLVINQSTYKKITDENLPDEKFDRKVNSIKYIMSQELRSYIKQAIKQSIKGETEAAIFELVLIGDNKEIDPESYVAAVKELITISEQMGYEFSYRIFIHDFKQCHLSDNEECYFRDEEIAITYYKDINELVETPYFSVFFNQDKDF